MERQVSNPNGVNLHAMSKRKDEENAIVSNPNGVNLHFEYFHLACPIARFKPQRGKFTLIKALYARVYSIRFKPQRGKFTP